MLYCSCCLLCLLKSTHLLTEFKRGLIAERWLSNVEPTPTVAVTSPPITHRQHHRYRHPHSPHSKAQHDDATHPQEHRIRGHGIRPSTRHDARRAPLLLAGFGSPFNFCASQRLGFCKGQSRRQYGCSVRTLLAFLRRQAQRHVTAAMKNRARSSSP